LTKALRNRIAEEFLGRVASLGSVKRAMLAVVGKWGVCERSVRRYAAEYRKTFGQTVR
jgi:hypothetical protein